VKMLTGAAALLRAGGALVYSVCSIAPEEGWGVVREFIARRPEFAIDRAPRVHPAIARELDAEGALLTRPDRGGRDGFFAVRIIRTR